AERYRGPAQRDARGARRRRGARPARLDPDVRRGRDERPRHRAVGAGASAGAGRPARGRRALRHPAHDHPARGRTPRRLLRRLRRLPPHPGDPLMAQLDKLLSVMISNRADELLLTEDAPAALLSSGQERPVTKALSAAQIAALLKEIAPAPAHAALDGKQPTKFQYASEDSVFAVRAMVHGDGKLSVRIQVDADGEFKRSTGTFTRAAVPEAAAPAAPGVATG